jgi:hypothetical protein
LPVWRLIAGIAVLGSLIAVLLALSPVYLDNYRLNRYVHELAASSGAPDETLRAEIVARAQQLDLPLQPGDVHVTHDGGKLHIDTKYVVKRDLALYSVDLHFHPQAAAR